MDNFRSTHRFGIPHRDTTRDEEGILLEDFEHEDAKPSSSRPVQPVAAERQDPRRSTSTKRCLRKITPRRLLVKLKVLIHYLLLALGTFYSAQTLSSIILAVWPQTRAWIAIQSPTYAPDTAFVGSDIFPIACHSHNDYWRPRPLFTALEHGCSAVEADIWSSPSSSTELLVGHTRSSLSDNRTLSTLYLDPLLEILDRANPDAEEVDRYNRVSTPGDDAWSGVFPTSSKTSLVLLIDFKSPAHDLWPLVYTHLDPFRRKGYLTYFNGSAVTAGPLTVVVSGNAPVKRVIENPVYRDIFFDAPLNAMALPPPIDQPDLASPAPSGPDPDHYNFTNSFYASSSFNSALGPLHRSKLTLSQLSLMRAQIRGAHARGLRVRYWGIPRWPVGVRNYLWRVMVREGVDFVSVDDVAALTSGDWGPRRGGWGGRWWF